MTELAIINAIQVCDVCGSSDIETKAWVKTNTKEFVDFEDSCDSETWCVKCENHCDTIEQSYYKRKAEQL